MTKHEPTIETQPWMDEYPRAKAFIEVHWYWAIPVGCFVGIAALSTLYWGMGELAVMWGFR